MSRYVEKKWRPPLILILGGSLMAILILPIYGAVFADFLTPMIGRRNAVYIVAFCAFVATLVLGWLLWIAVLQKFVVGFPDFETSGRILNLLWDHDQGWGPAVDRP